MATVRCRVLTPVDIDQVRYIDDAVVAWDAAGRITTVTEWDGRNVDKDVRPGVLMPGFVDAHLHYPQTRIIGSATGPLLEWLEQSTFPEELRFESLGHAERVAEIFCSCLASAGTTLSVVYGSVHPRATDKLFQVLDRRKMRAIAGPVLMDSHSPPGLTLPPEIALPELEALADRWHGHDEGRLKVAVIPRFALSCTMKMMKGAAKLANERKLLVTTHLSENLAECEAAVSRFGTEDYLQVYEKAGLVHERALFAHCVHLSRSEWVRMQGAGAMVAHCPDSNRFLGSGGMPTEAARKRGVPILLGTDVAAGRSFRIPRIASAAYDNALSQGLSLSLRELFWWSTRGAALHLGEKQVGALAPGLDADLIWLDLPSWVDNADQALSWVLLDHDSPRPRRTWVRGQKVWDRSSASRRGGGFPWSNDPRIPPGIA